jgi:hypothetical protein
MSLSSLIQSNDSLKKIARWALISPNQYRPRLMGKVVS